MSLEREQIYSVWAPEGAPWSPWVKPVIFTQIGQGRPAEPPPSLDPLDVSWAPEPTVETLAEPDGYRAAPERVRTAASRRAALVVDLPALESVRVGLSLIARGYRPIPLFNAAAGAPPGHVAHTVVWAIREGTKKLEQTPLPLDAPPAFLLDSARSEGEVTPGKYDGRWIVFPQDFPSGHRLRAHGIEQVVHRTAQAPAKPSDLAHVLVAWKEQGVELLGSWSGAPEPAPLNVRTPSGYRSLVHRALALVGLRRNAAGGFGGMVPLPSSGGSGYS